MHRHLAFSSLLVLLAACGTKETSDDTATTGDDTSTDTGDTATDTAQDTGGDDTSDTGEDTAAPADLAIAGEWVDNWFGSHTITNSLWTSGGQTIALTDYDNAARVVVGQNGAANDWNPGLWSRFDWTWDVNGQLWACQTAYDAASEADAWATPPADSVDLGAGCGGFAWTMLRAPLAISDRYDDSWGGFHVVDAFNWSDGWGNVFHIWTTTEDAVVAQNDGANSYNPGLWSRFTWTRDDAGALYYCQSAYDAATLADAAASTADARSLDAGCGGFSWTEIRSTLPVNGTWSDDYGGSHAIDAFVWSSWGDMFLIAEAHESEGWVVAQNAASNSYNPSLWSRFDWTLDDTGALYYCQSAYDAATQADAAASEPDASDPATSGCGGFSWTALTPSSL